MEIEVIRYNNKEDFTGGLLFIDGQFECYTLEDEYRTQKVYAETRIPDGRYKVSLRTEGGHHIRYSKKFPDLHKGMLHILDVPNFKWILIHGWPCFVYLVVLWRWFNCTFFCIFTTCSGP